MAPASIAELALPHESPAQRGLLCGAVYERIVAASSTRVWENVLDWEHLPWLHAESFLAIDLEDRGAWGWRARAKLAEPAKRSVRIQLRVDRKRGRYLSETLAGPGAGTEIWTSVAPLAEDRTQIRVEFWVRDSNRARAEARAAGLRRSYVQLWDEDERMMQQRTRELALRSARAARGSQCLGALEPLRASLPRSVELSGRRVRILEIDGRLHAFAAQCPHMLGPLDEAPIDDGHVTCPWHGYRFDICTGMASDGRKLALEPVRIEIDATTGRVWLHVGEAAQSDRSRENGAAPS